MIEAKPHSFLFNKSGNQDAKVTVCISLYNYQNYIAETLESVYKQTIDQLNLIVVDDCSKDSSAAIAHRWLERRQQRFNSVYLIKHTANSGLPASRNTALSLAETPFIFILDADNILYPRCIARCLEAIEASDAAFVYPIIEKFGGYRGLLGNMVWNLERLARQNYIDAMSMLRKSALLEVGGYSYMQITGWEDYELWCKFAERDYYGVLVPEILAKYRVHETSMLNTTTNKSENIGRLIDDMMNRHPWLKLRSAD